MRSIWIVCARRTSHSGPCGTKYTLLGCGALKELDPRHGEIKSMRTPSALRGRGAARAMLRHIIDVARSRGYSRLSLETGAQEFFKPAHALYESAGFVRCGPFADYSDDPNSLYLTLDLTNMPQG